MKQPRVTNGPVDLSGGLLEVSGVLPPECMRRKLTAWALIEKVGAVNAPSTYLGLMAGRGSFLKQLQEARVYQEVPGCSKCRGEKEHSKYRTFAILKKLTCSSHTFVYINKLYFTYLFLKIDCIKSLVGFSISRRLLTNFSCLGQCSNRSFHFGEGIFTLLERFCL